MGKGTMKPNLMFNADGMSAALDAATKRGLPCGPCTHKLQTQHEMSQSDFCTACQHAVNAQLASIVENWIKGLLVRMGFPSDSVEISKNYSARVFMKKKPKRRSWRSLGMTSQR